MFQGLAHRIGTMLTPRWMTEAFWRSKLPEWVYETNSTLRILQIKEWCSSLLPSIVRQGRALDRHTSGDIQESLNYLVLILKGISIYSVQYGVLFFLLFFFPLGHLPMVIGSWLGTIMSIESGHGLIAGYILSPSLSTLGLFALVSNFLRVERIGQIIEHQDETRREAHNAVVASVQAGESAFISELMDFLTAAKDLVADARQSGITLRLPIHAHRFPNLLHFFHTTMTGGSWAKRYFLPETNETFSTLPVFDRGDQQAGKGKETSAGVPEQHADAGSDAGKAGAGGVGAQYTVNTMPSLSWVWSARIASSLSNPAQNTLRAKQEFQQLSDPGKEFVHKALKKYRSHLEYEAAENAENWLPHPLLRKHVYLSLLPLHDYRNTSLQLPQFVRTLEARIVDLMHRHLPSTKDLGFSSVAEFARLRLLNVYNPDDNSRPNKQLTRAENQRAVRKYKSHVLATDFSRQRAAQKKDVLLIGQDGDPRHPVAFCIHFQLYERLLETNDYRKWRLDCEVLAPGPKHWYRNGKPPPYAVRQAGLRFRVLVQKRW
ncbi:unnamed protein product, partial [Amoebophrya sp. A120]|eukprot:GSA120T00024980001.1